MRNQIHREMNSFFLIRRKQISQREDRTGEPFDKNLLNDRDRNIYSFYKSKSKYIRNVKLNYTCFFFINAFNREEKERCTFAKIRLRPVVASNATKLRPHFERDLIRLCPIHICNKAVQVAYHRATSLLHKRLAYHA